jgi:hypothetical protein
MRWLRLAAALAGAIGPDGLDMETAHDLAAELVIGGRIMIDGDRITTTGRLRPYAEWAGGEVLAAVQARAEAERAFAQAEGMF